MALTLTYDDAYLKDRITDPLEARAAQEVDDMRIGAIADNVRERLVVLRAYILVCLEHQANPDDLYAAKLKNYRAEFDAALARARASVPDAAGSSFVFSIPLERA